MKRTHIPNICLRFDTNYDIILVIFNSDTDSILNKIPGGFYKCHTVK